MKVNSLRLFYFVFRENHSSAGALFFLSALSLLAFPCRTARSNTGIDLFLREGTTYMAFNFMAKKD